MATFDKQKFAAALDDNALPPFGRGVCATYVRKALEAAGLNTAGHPFYAKDWGPTLLRLGFAAVPADGFSARLGDVAVIQSTSQSVAGHIEGFDGKNWVSDFVQPAFWPGPGFRTEKPAYTVYRWPF
ncbi:MAG TPA: hypothetical protein VGG99_00620 [Acetobacteraceae bacterium]|jgi:hypothetical protein